MPELIKDGESILDAQQLGEQKQSNAEAIGESAAAAGAVILESLIGKKKPDKADEKAGESGEAGAEEKAGDAGNGEDGGGDAGKNGEDESKGGDDAGKVEPEEKQAKPKKAQKRRKIEEDLDGADDDKDDERIAKIAGKAAAEAIKGAGHKPEDDDGDVDISPDDLPDQYKAYADALAELPQIDKKKYGGRNLLKELADSIKAQKAYEKKWKKEHPGVEFDPSDSEHEEFFASNVVDVSEADIRKAERAIIKREAVKEAESKIKEELSGDIAEVKASKRARELAPKIQKGVAKAQRAIIESIGPEYVEAMKAGGDKLTKALEEDGVALEAATSAGSWGDAILEHRFKFEVGAEKFTPGNKKHEWFRDQLIEIESDLAGADDAPVLDDGREFATRQEWAALPESKRGKYYTIADFDAISDIVAYKASKMAKAVVDERKKWLAKYGYERKARQASQSKQEQKTSGEHAHEKKQQSPTVTSAIASSGANDKQAGALPDAFWSAIGAKPRQ